MKKPSGYNFNLLEQLVTQSISIFLYREKEAIINNVSERNNCGRLAIYMNSILERYNIPQKYIVDIEYNRKQEGKIKTIIDNEENIINITCDLILHSRGREHPDNLIAIEVKKYDRPKIEKEKDKIRLCALTKKPGDNIYPAYGMSWPIHVCDYILGTYMELNRKNNSCFIEYFHNGKSIRKKIIDF
jgi:hypothetical protein